jgi:hypothetical protein
VAGAGGPTGCRWARRAGAVERGSPVPATDWEPLARWSIVGSRWSGLDAGAGHLPGRELTVTVL